VGGNGRRGGTTAADTPHMVSATASAVVGSCSWSRRTSSVARLFQNYTSTSLRMGEYDLDVVELITNESERSLIGCADGFLLKSSYVDLPLSSMMSLQHLVPSGSCGKQ
jgi:hypothetical protein